jgi:hypothetical protein
LGDSRALFPDSRDFRVGAGFFADMVSAGEIDAPAQQLGALVSGKNANLSQPSLVI